MDYLLKIMCNKRNETCLYQIVEVDVNLFIFKRF